MEQSGIIAFAFSAHKFGQNKWLASAAMDLAQTYQCPVFTQRDYLDIPVTSDVGYVTEEPNKPAPTLRIAFEAIFWARQKRITRVFVVAAPPHLRRCLRDIRYAIHVSGAKEIKVDDGTPVNFSDVTWFTPDAGQLRTRSRVIWYVREIVIRVFPWIYRRLAK